MQLKPERGGGRGNHKGGGTVCSLNQESFTRHGRGQSILAQGGLPCTGMEMCLIVAWPRIGMAGQKTVAGKGKELCSRGDEVLPGGGFSRPAPELESSAGSRKSFRHEEMVTFLIIQRFLRLV